MKWLSLQLLVALVIHQVVLSDSPALLRELEARLLAGEVVEIHSGEVVAGEVQALE